MMPLPSSRSPSSLHPPCSIFTPIRECEGEGDDVSETKSQSISSTSFIEKSPSVRHNPTPLHEKEGKSKKRHEDYGSVSCNKCRPNSREKISVVPLDSSSHNGLNKHSFSIVSPNTIFKSIFSSLTRKSPKSTDSREEQWKIAVEELSHKLIEATRKRDEAILEASRLKNSMAELEKKLSKLEVCCHNFKSGLDQYTGDTPRQVRRVYQQSVTVDKAVEQFLVSVSDARSSIRLLSRALTLQVRHLGTKVHERLSALLQPYGIKISISKNPKSVLFYLEALLNKCFFEDFESIGYQKNSTNQILNPIDRCETNNNSFDALKRLTWEDVLSKGTRHFSDEFSRFCDRKMSEIVAMLEWNRAWTEPLLQAFFNASKSVWLMHLLANSVHPSLPIFRVDKGVSFDSGYMEDMGGDRARKLVPTTVRIMVAPGFYVYGNVVKCKVLCRYHNNPNENHFSNSNDDQDLTSP